MTRWRASVIFLVTLAACGGGGSKPAPRALTAAIVPADAESVVTVDASALAQLSPVTSALSKVPLGELEAALEHGRACGYELAALRRLVVAEGDSFRGDRRLLGIEGPGFGRESSLRCLAQRVEQPLELETLDGRRVGHLGEDTATTIIALDEDRVLIAGELWAQPVAGLLEGQGRSALDTAFTREVEGLIPREGALVWYAGDLPAGFGIMTMFTQGLFDDVERVAVAMRPADEADRLLLEVGLLYGDEESAERLLSAYKDGYKRLARLRKDRRQMAELARMIGLSVAALASSRGRREGRWVVLSSKLKEGDVYRGLKKATSSPFARLGLPH